MIAKVFYQREKYAITIRSGNKCNIIYKSSKISALKHLLIPSQRETWDKLPFQLASCTLAVQWGPAYLSKRGALKPLGREQPVAQGQEQHMALIGCSGTAPTWGSLRCCSTLQRLRPRSFPGDLPRQSNTSTLPRTATLIITLCDLQKLSKAFNIRE